MNVRREMELVDCVFISVLSNFVIESCYDDDVCLMNLVHVVEVLLMGGIVHAHMRIGKVTKRIDYAYNNKHN